MTDLQNKVKYDSNGLVPVIAQDDRTDEVLMLAYMTKESLAKTLETGYAHYYSRSRQKLWLKGETSGHYQKVKSIRIDCDGDTLLIKVIQTGEACHLGHHSCFFTGTNVMGRPGEVALRQLGMEAEQSPCPAESQGQPISKRPEEMEGPEEAMGSERTIENEKTGVAGGTERTEMSERADESGEIPDVGILGELFDVISNRLDNPREGSYTNYLFSKGTDKILKKIGEESSEVIIAAKNDGKEDLKAEIADLIYHVIVLLVNQGLTMEDIYKELRKRR